MEDNVIDQDLVVVQEFLKLLLDQVYIEIEHGNEDHRKWLKGKFESIKQRLHVDPKTNTVALQKDELLIPEESNPS